MLSSQLNQSIVVVSLISTFFTAEFNTSSIESISSISIFSVLKRHFELRYRLDFFDSLDLLIMKCMKNVIDFQQILNSIIQENDKRFKSRRMIEDHEERKQISSDQWDLNVDQLF
jgi:hypothetical protein